ncbi:hypothetical protein ACH4SP_34235 [Streptomyces sp. NPDC021093]|uniref:hypothetical protein n=1 Tax=Streptomyces sp. NPDC021093 TaxID=3365112 RepID=UPI00378927BD
MKRSIKNPVLRKAVVLVTFGCAAALFSVAVPQHDAPAPGHTVTVLAGGGGKEPNEWNSQG